MARIDTDREKTGRADMTPMIDCVFLLIVFFLCIDFRTLEAKLPAWLPKAHGSSPAHTEPVEQLSVRIVCDEVGQEVARRDSVGPQRARNNVRMVGHRVHWLVGPRRFDDPTGLMDGLQQIAADPRRRVPDDRTGGTRILPVVIEPGPSTTYGDVASTVDSVRFAGFDDISFGGGLRAPRSPRGGSSASVEGR
ncbi:MAG: biopolymer transporter ExbD [Planctomycetes bacterium]|nr:biopolymer transporter ExbD [Planctomycetota bacterium]